MTVDELGKVAKSVGVKAADGTKETSSVADHASVNAGKYSILGVKKEAHVTVPFTEEARKKTIHSFEHF
jgi:hypothetical protein